MLETSSKSALTIFTRSYYSRTLLNEKNILLKNLICFRKPNLRRQTYFIILKKTSTGGKQVYYKLFMTSLKKKKRFHRNNCYGSGSLADYAENINISRVRFSEHIK